MYVALDHGRPTASTEDEKRARKFAELAVAQAGRAGRGLSWTPTGKLMTGNRWTGWEVHPARRLDEER